MLTGSVPGDLESPWLLDHFEGATWGELSKTCFDGCQTCFRRFDHKEKEVHSVPKPHLSTIALCSLLLEKVRFRCGIGH